MLKTSTKLLISGLLAAAFSGCVMESGDCTGTLPNTGDTRTLQLNVMVPAAESVTSRTEKENDVTHVPEKGSAAENYLGFDEFDYKVLIFDESGSLLEEFVPETTATQDADKGTLTTLIGPISTKDKDGNRLENIQIMVLANWQHFDDGRYNGFTAGTTTLNGLSSNGTNFNFTMPIMTNSVAWSPSITSSPKRLIPMFGLSDKIELNYDNAEPVGNGGVILPDVKTPTIQMLRAVAKIEVVDKLPEGAGPIESVTLDKSNAEGRYIPDFNTNDLWYERLTQVKTVSLPSGSIGTVNNLKFFKERKTIDGEDVDVWSAYIPEMALPATKTDRPKFTVDYGGSQPGEFVLDYLTESEPTGTLTQVLRNHIYRFTANRLKGVSVNATLEVNPWELEEEEEWDYQNTVTVGENGYLEWKGWYEKAEDGSITTDGIKDRGILDKENYQLVMGAGEVWVKGDFKIDSPINATWYAYFRTVEGKEDAFIFVDKNGEQLTDSEGNPLTTASGPVGEKVTIYIKNKEAEVSANNIATLVVMVQTVDNRWLEADLCNGNGENWTIVQNRTDIYDNEEAGGSENSGN